MKKDVKEELISKLEILKEKIIEYDFPDKKQLLIGIDITILLIEEYNLRIVSNTEIDNLVYYIYDNVYNQTSTLSFDYKRGIDMAINNINKNKKLIKKNR